MSTFLSCFKGKQQGCALFYLFFFFLLKEIYIYILFFNASSINKIKDLHIESTFLIGFCFSHQICWMFSFFCSEKHFFQFFQAIVEVHTLCSSNFKNNSNKVNAHSPQRSLTHSNSYINHLPFWEDFNTMRRKVLCIYGQLQARP